MAKLRVQIPGELTLEFTCENLAEVRRRALAFVGDAERLTAVCQARAVATLSFCEDEDAPGAVWRNLDWDAPAPAFFFDNTTYNVYARLEAQSGCTDLRVKSRFASDEGVKRFARHEGGLVRDGDINFENDVGFFDFTLAWRGADGAERTFTFSSEVLSQKLDARADWKTMVGDIEARYSMLAADYLRRTHHSFSRTKISSRDTPDLIWWNLFEAERETFFKAVRTVIEHPRRRLTGTVEHLRADGLRHLTPSLENAYGEYRRTTAHLYRVSRDAHTRDTPENRFVKHALAEIGRKYGKLRELICAESQFGARLSAEAKAGMRMTEHRLQALAAHPFFRGVGRYTGLRQMSATLQSAPGYASVARTYALLNASYMLFDGLRRLETKSIADLYEIWCFLKVEEVVKRSCQMRFGAFFREPVANHGELSGRFVRQLGTGARSEVVYTIRDAARGEDIELARVVYNPKLVDAPQADNGLPQTVVPTGLTGNKGQIPDIVLQLTRESMNQDDRFRLTYLFDAKYRIEDADGEDGNLTMRPPQDAIDQMHRYRDAIYYAERGKEHSLDPNDLKREVVGGYVLFPGKVSAGVTVGRPGENEEDRRPKYFSSIDQVNIGAIPLRPNDAENGERGHLECFVDRLLAESPTVEAALDRLNPQKGELVGSATQEGIAGALVCGTYAAGQKQWIRTRRLYNLPLSTAEKVGIFSEEDAKAKRVLVLMSPRGYVELSAPYAIVSCRKVTKDQLWHEVGYFREPSHGEGYWLFGIKPLIESMDDVARRLKIVTLDKTGVCRGVRTAAESAGMECAVAEDMETAVRSADGVVVFSDGASVPAGLRANLRLAERLRKSHQPLAMNMRYKKTRKTFVRWLRILLTQVTTRKYVLFVDGAEDEAGMARADLSLKFLSDALEIL